MWTWPRKSWSLGSVQSSVFTEWICGCGLWGWLYLGIRAFFTSHRLWWCNATGDLILQQSDGGDWMAWWLVRNSNYDITTIPVCYQCYCDWSDKSLVTTYKISTMDNKHIFTSPAIPQPRVNLVCCLFRWQSSCLTAAMTKQFANTHTES